MPALPSIIRRQYSALSRVPFAKSNSIEASPGSGYPFPGDAPTDVSFNSDNDFSKFATTLRDYIHESLSCWMLLRSMFESSRFRYIPPAKQPPKPPMLRSNHELPA